MAQQLLVFQGFTCTIAAAQCHWGGLHGVCAACRGVLGKRGRVEGQWGGSILDSVVGVFLTQNVSDALSSKAWMNLAATFPLPAYKKDSLDSIDWEAVRTAPVEKVTLTAGLLSSYWCASV